MEICMSALLATAFAFRNAISLLCVSAIAIGMTASPNACRLLWRYLVCLESRPSTQTITKQMVVPDGLSV